MDEDSWPERYPWQEGPTEAGWGCQGGTPSTYTHPVPVAAADERTVQPKEGFET